MQPYFMPYIGYFQLIAAVDKFIIYDNIQYTKKGWINRNRMLQNSKHSIFSLPLKNGSASLDVCERELAVDFNRSKLLNQFKGAYQSAPYFEQTLLLIEQILQYEDTNLFRFLHHSIVKTCKYLAIDTEIKISSEIAIDHALKSQEKVIALCQAIGATTYINAIGGMEIYNRDVFQAQGFEIKFIRSQPFEYKQFGAPFLPWLSIVDALMFNTPVQIGIAIREGYELV